MLKIFYYNMTGNVGINLIGQTTNNLDSVNNKSKGNLLLQNVPRLREQNNQDTFVNSSNQGSSKKKLSTVAKWAIGISAAALTVVGGFFTHKFIKANQFKRAMNAIDVRFADLETKLPEVQKTFREVFMRDDITLEQTKKMLGRYKHLEILRVNGSVSKEEYTKALFDEAVKNYGLEHAGIKWRLDPIKDKKRTGGFWSALENTVVIKSTMNKENIFSIIHHELRHAKQSQAIAEHLPDEDVIKYLQKSTYDALKKMGMEPGDYKSWIKEVWTPDFTEDTVQTFRSRICNAKSIKNGVVHTEKDVEYARKMFEGQMNYTGLEENHAAYWKNAQEIDARRAETLIDKLFGVDKSRIAYYEKMDAKYLTKAK